MPPRRQASRRAAAAKAAKAKKAAEALVEEAAEAPEDTSAVEETAEEITEVTETQEETVQQEPTQEQAMQEEAVQAEATQEEAMQEEAVQEESVQEESAQEETANVEGDGAELMGDIEKALSGHEQTADEAGTDGQQLEEGPPEETAPQEMAEEGGNAEEAGETENFAEDEETAAAKDGENEGEKGGKVWPKPEKELPIKGRVLRVHPVLMQDLAGKAVAPILRASVGYIIRSEGGSKPQKKTTTMDLARSLEIWFHSEEEAEEMFVRMCNFKWTVNGRLARVVRVNSPESVDVTLKEWDKSIAPLGMYDGRCLFVNNIPTNTTEEDLKALFENTKKIQIPTDEEGNQQGYALIEFWKKADAVESSKKKLTMQETQLSLHTIGIQRIPRTKAAQDRLDLEMKRIRDQGVLTDLATPRPKVLHITADGEKKWKHARRENPPRRRDLRPPQGMPRRDMMRRNRPGGWQEDPRDGKRRFSGGREMGSPMKRGRMDRGRFSGGMMGGGDFYPGPMNRRGRGGRGMGNNADSIRGELLGQMQHLQQGGLSDPQYLMNLAKRLQQAQYSNY